MSVVSMGDMGRESTTADLTGVLAGTQPKLHCGFARSPRYDWMRQKQSRCALERRRAAYSPAGLEAVGRELHLLPLRRINNVETLLTEGGTSINSNAGVDIHCMGCKAAPKPQGG